jgi:hypothetical protein
MGREQPGRRLPAEREDGADEFVSTAQTDSPGVSNASQSKLRTPSVNGDSVMSQNADHTRPPTTASASSGCQNRSDSSRWRTSVATPHRIGKTLSTARLNTAFGWANVSVGSATTNSAAAPGRPSVDPRARPIRVTTAANAPGSRATASRFGHRTPNDIRFHGNAVKPTASTGVRRAAPVERPST